MRYTALQPRAAPGRAVRDSPRKHTRRSRIDRCRRGDAGRARPIATGCVPRARGHHDIDTRSASGGRSRPGASPPSWPIAEARDDLPCPGVHGSPQPGPCGPCSLPGQRAPEFFTEQNGGRPVTRAMEQGMDAPARVLRLPRVQARTGLARSTIYVRVADGSFPQPIRLGARAVGWIESEVDAWIREALDPLPRQARHAARRPPRARHVKPVISVWATPSRPCPGRPSGRASHPTPPASHPLPRGGVRHCTGGGLQSLPDNVG